jgi:hypothetical protein
MGADKVSDVLGQQLDVEFDDEIQDNMHLMQGRRTDGSSAPDIEDEEEGEGGRNQNENPKMMVPLIPD